jgi:hypothetical protein
LTSGDDPRSGRRVMVGTEVNIVIDVEADPAEV